MQNTSSESSNTSTPTRGTDAPLAVFAAPNGLKVFHHAEAETKYVYQEIFEDRVYLRHGISIGQGDCVLDIGANIGLFTIFLRENYERIKVVAIEPSPTILRVLRANVEKYGNEVQVFGCGVSSRSGHATFTFYPHYSIMSGFHTNLESDSETLRNGIRSHLKEQGMDDMPDRALDRMTKVALGEKQEYQCQLRTISEIIEEAQIQTVGLMKIDAEGSELEVLAGIKEEHWNKIKQIVMEVHDLAGDIAVRVKKILEARGYSCVFEEEKRLTGSGVINCFARQL